MPQFDSGFTGELLEFIEKSDLDSEDLCRKESPNFCNKLLSRQTRKGQALGAFNFEQKYCMNGSAFACSIALSLPRGNSNPRIGNSHWEMGHFKTQGISTMF